MHVGKLVFAQLMEHLPWKTFGRIVERYGGDHRIRDFSCATQLRCMAFAQLAYRESLRDIETCLRAQSAKLYHLGIRGAVVRSTLADANEARNWRIYAEFAQHLIRIARRLYLDEPFGVDLKETVYALDSTTIDLCLTLFPWAPFRSTKAAIKLHTLIDLRVRSTHCAANFQTQSGGLSLRGPETLQLGSATRGTGKSSNTWRCGPPPIISRCLYLHRKRS